MYLGIGAAAEFIGVSVDTLRRWEKSGYFISDYRTKGGHRRYSIKRLKSEILNIPDKTQISLPKKTLAYARVSSHDQKLDLKRQSKRLENYCAEKNYNYDCVYC